MTLQPESNNSTGSRKRAGVRKMLRHHLKVDMTPMVDLGFLLITFFVMTAEMSKPVSMPLNMPKDGPPMEVENSNALTVLIDQDAIYYYQGDWVHAVETGAIHQVSLTGPGNLRRVIGTKQLQLDKTPHLREGRDGLMVLVKAGQRASYKQLVDVLDETVIMQVKKYAIVNLSEAEENWLRVH